MNETSTAVTSTTQIKREVATAFIIGSAGIGFLIAIFNALGGNSDKDGKEARP